MYDYAMGGKDNYQADRDASEEIRAALPNALAAVQENRRFMRRAVRHLLSVGVRQFLDIGCGMPGRGNVHDLAAAVDPSATVVYVDNEPMVVNHYQAQLSSSPVAAALLADLRRPGDILSSPVVRGLIRFDRPVGIVMTALLHYFEDEDDPAGLVKEFVSAVPSGSHLVLTHYHPEGISPKDRAVAAEMAAALDVTMVERRPAEIEALFGELVLIEPGLVPPPLWRPDRLQRDPTGWLLAGVGRKP